MNAEKLFLILLLPLINSCEVAHKPPKFTICAALSVIGVKNCVDNRLPGEKTGKDMPIQPGDIIMPAESFQALLNWGAGLRKDLIQCESGR